MARRFAIPLDRAGGDSLGQAFQHARQQGQVVPDDFDVDLAGRGHRGQVAHQAEAGHVGAGMRAALDHQLRGALVERGHRSCGGFRPARRRAADLRGEGHDARAQRLGQDQAIARPGAGVGDDPVGMDQSGDGEAGLDLVVVDAVAADDGHAGLGHFVHAAAENLLQDLVRQRCAAESRRSKGP